MAEATWKHRAEYALVCALETSMATLPERWAHGLGAGAGALVGSSLRVRRRVVESNLRLAFPDASEAWISLTADAAYRHLGREAAAILRMSRVTREEIVRRTETRGWDALEEALSDGRGALLVTGHFGNWEIAAAAVAARGIPIAAIVRRQGNRQVDARLDALRRSLGVETIPQSEAPRRVPRLLRANGVVGIVGDQDARRAGVFVPFFGRLASTARGTALFALRLDAPVFACTARRLQGPQPRYLVAGERIPVVRTGDLDADVQRLTGALAASLEAAVRAAPEQYFWFHKRWKTPPPPELATPGLGTTPNPNSGPGPGERRA